MAWKMLIIVISSRERIEEKTPVSWFTRKNSRGSGTTHICSVAANEKNDLDDELTDFLAVAKRAML